jgi:hypothetical protein
MTNINGLPLGFDALLDLRYAHYWPRNNGNAAVGIMTGVSAGYLQTQQRCLHYKDEFILATDEGDVPYCISADTINERISQIQLEVPIMLSLVTSKGLFLNVGPKFILPVYSTFRQTIANDQISAYRPELNGKPITNEVIMGKLTDAQRDLLMEMRWQALRDAGEEEIENNVYSFSELTGYEVLDPYGRDLDCYRYVYELIAGGMSALTAKLLPAEIRAKLIEKPKKKVKKES